MQLAYDVFDAHPSMTVFACMAQARRKFKDCLKYEPEKAEHVITETRKLYAIERQLRESAASAEERLKVPQGEARPILEALKSWLEATAGLSKATRLGICLTFGQG